MFWIGMIDYKLAHEVIHKNSKDNISQILLCIKLFSHETMHTFNT